MSFVCESFTWHISVVLFGDKRHTVFLYPVDDNCIMYWSTCSAMWSCLNWNHCFWSKDALASVNRIIKRQPNALYNSTTLNRYKIKHIPSDVYGFSKFIPLLKRENCVGIKGHMTQTIWVPGAKKWLIPVLCYLKIVSLCLCISIQHKSRFRCSSFFIFEEHSST